MNSEILIYQAADGAVKIDVRLEEDTVWLTQSHMARLFGKAKSTVNGHIKNIFAEGELVENDVMKKFGISEFQQKAPNFYNLDAIIQMNGRELLTHAGKVSHEMALEKSGLEYQKFKEKERTLESEQSFKELEDDIKSLKQIESDKR